MWKTLRRLYHQIVYAGVDEKTPTPLVDRVVFSNLVVLAGSAVNILMAVDNYFTRRFFLLLCMNGYYQVGLCLAVYLNTRRFYLGSRLLLVFIGYTGFFFTGLFQGPVVEIEHFFFPLALLSFGMFYAEERRFSFAFLILAMLCYGFLVFQHGPLLKIDPDFTRYTTGDRAANRIGYIALFFTFVISLSNAYNRALGVIESQRNHLFEERRFASMGTMATNMAHEINSPLTALDLQLYQLESLLEKGDVAPGELRERIVRMRGISRRISVIVRGLKFLSRQDNNDPVSPRTIAKILEVTVDLVRDRMAQSEIRFEWKMDNPQAQLFCRPVALSQVFLNLLNNAIDAVAKLPEADRWIALESRNLSPSRLAVTITDGGHISSPEVREKLFQNFFTTKAPGQGMGLGLSISRETVVAHQGELRFVPESPHTQFVVELPVGG